MQIVFIRNLTKQPGSVRHLLFSRIGRIISRFGNRITGVTIKAREQAGTTEVRPQASCSVQCKLAGGGQVHAGARATQLLPAIAKLCNDLNQQCTNDPRLKKSRQQPSVN